jgi:hypothetical protein
VIRRVGSLDDERSIQFPTADEQSRADTVDVMPLSSQYIPLLGETGLTLTKLQTGLLEMQGQRGISVQSAVLLGHGSILATETYSKVLEFQLNRKCMA